MALIRHEKLEDRSAFALASLNTDFNPPSSATGGVFYWRISAVAGTTPIADCKLQYEDATSGQFVDVDNGAFAQKLAASTQVLTVLPGGAADATGDFRSTNALLSSQMRAVFTFDRTSADETYTFTLSVDWIE